MAFTAYFSILPHGPTHGSPAKGFMVVTQRQLEPCDSRTGVHQKAMAETCCSKETKKTPQKRGLDMQTSLLRLGIDNHQTFP